MIEWIIGIVSAAIASFITKKLSKVPTLKIEQVKQLADEAYLAIQDGKLTDEEARRLVMQIIQILK